MVASQMLDGLATCRACCPPSTARPTFSPLARTAASSMPPLIVRHPTFTRRPPSTTCATAYLPTICA
eukprot:scaffold2623_cov78-Phaeocystis_antarctica.AAC.4